MTIPALLALPAPAKCDLIPISDDERHHLRLTLNQLKNLALEAQQQGVISRFTHNNLIEDISQSFSMLNRAQG